MTCPHDGVLALTTLGLTEAHPEPCLVLVTSCRDHVRAVRTWLQHLALDDVDTWNTDLVLDHLEQMQDLMEDTPVVELRQMTG